MLAANDFSRCVSALETTLINKRNELDELNKKYVNAEVDSKEELEIEKELELKSKIYRDALSSYNESLGLL